MCKSCKTVLVPGVTCAVRVKRESVMELARALSHHPRTPTEPPSRSLGTPRAPDRAHMLRLSSYTTSSGATSSSRGDAGRRRQACPGPIHRDTYNNQRDRGYPYGTTGSGGQPTLEAAEAGSQARSSTCLFREAGPCYHCWGQGHDGHRLRCLECTSDSPGNLLLLNVESCP